MELILSIVLLLAIGGGVGLTRTEKRNLQVLGWFIQAVGVVLLFAYCAGVLNRYG